MPRFSPYLLLAAVALVATGCPPQRRTERAWGDRVLYHPPGKVSAGEPGWHDVYEPLAGRVGEKPALTRARDRLLEAVRVARSAFGEGRFTDRAQPYAEIALLRGGPLDLDGLYRRLPDTGEAARVIHFTAGPQEEGYRIDLTDGDSEPTPQLGGATLAIGLEPDRWREKPTYRLHADLLLDTGTIAGPDAVLALDRFLERLATPSQGPPSHAVDEKTLAALDAAERSLLGEIQSAAPRLLERLLNLFIVGDLQAPDPDGGVHPNLAFSRRDEGFRRHFPALARYLGRLDGVFDIDVELSPEGEGPTDRAVFRSQGTRLEMALHPSSGAPRAFDRSGTISLEARASGLTFKIEKLPLEVEFSPGPATGRLEVRLDRPPRSMGVEGRALGFLDKRLIQAVSGIDLDRFLRDFLVALTRGRDGQGTRLAIEWGPHGERNRLRVTLEAELLANPLIGTASRIATRLYTPPDRALGEARALIDIVLEALEADLESLEETTGDSP